MTTWSVGEVVNTLGSHPSIRGSNPLRTTIFYVNKKESKSFLFKNVCLYKKNGWGNWIRTSEMADSESAALPLGYTPKKMAGVTGFEPVKWQIQSLFALPLGYTPTAIYIIHIF